MVLLIKGSYTREGGGGGRAGVYCPKNCDHMGGGGGGVQIKARWPHEGKGRGQRYITDEMWPQEGRKQRVRCI